MIQTQLKARFSHFVTLDVTPLKNASRACALHIVEASLEKSCAHENTKMRFYERGSCDIEFGIFTVERTEKENQFSVVLSTEKNNTLNFFQSYQLQCLIVQLNASGHNFYNQGQPALSVYLSLKALNFPCWHFMIFCARLWFLALNETFG